MLIPREKSPLPENSPEEDRTRDAVDSEPKHYQRAIPAPQIASLIWSFCFSVAACKLNIADLSLTMQGGGGGAVRDVDGYDQ